METYTGRKFWPIDPRPEDVCIEDIAHALSQQCRFYGHCHGFLSVAQHSVMVYRYVRQYHAAGRELAMKALLHDASEAYCGDMIPQLKPYVPRFVEIQGHIQRAIWRRFGMTVGVPKRFPAPGVPEVKEADLRCLAGEACAYMMGQADNSGRPWWERFGPRYCYDDEEPLVPCEAEQLFLASWDECQTLTED